MLEKSLPLFLHETCFLLAITFPVNHNTSLSLEQFLYHINITLGNSIHRILSQIHDFLPSPIKDSSFKIQYCKK